MSLFGGPFDNPFATYDPCCDRYPANYGITCSLPHGHASPHAMGHDGATWPLHDEGNTHE